MATQTNENPPAVIAEQMAMDRAQRREERQSLTAIPAADLATAPSRLSFIPQSMGEAMQLATIMARSTFVPMHCRSNEGNCLAIIMQAGRWGMDPFAVANKAYFVKDGAPPAFESQLINAVVNSSGALLGRLRILVEGEGEAMRCTVRGFLKADPGEEKVKTQSIARISVRNSPLWKSDPDQQLSYYTTRAWARLHCPEVLLGVYTPEEMDGDPAGARVIAPEMPRRINAAAPRAAAADALDDEPHDKVTGEVVRDARGMTIVDEATERALDAGAVSPEAAGEDSEDRADAREWVNGLVTSAAACTTADQREALRQQHAGTIGDLEVAYPDLHEIAVAAFQAILEPEQGDNIPAWTAKVVEIRAGVAAAKNATYLKAMDTELGKIRVVLPDEIIEELDKAITAKRKSFQREPAT